MPEQGGGGGAKKEGGRDRHKQKWAPEEVKVEVEEVIVWAFSGSLEMETKNLLWYFFHIQLI